MKKLEVEKVHRMTDAYERTTGQEARCDFFGTLTLEYLLWSFLKMKAFIGNDRHFSTMTEEEWGTFLDQLEAEIPPTGKGNLK